MFVEQEGSSDNVRIITLSSVYAHVCVEDDTVLPATSGCFLLGDWVLKAVPLVVLSENSVHNNFATTVLRSSLAVVCCLQVICTTSATNNLLMSK
jgi:hypothetical protein